MLRHSGTPLPSWSIFKQIAVCSYCSHTLYVLLYVLKRNGQVSCTFCEFVALRPWISKDKFKNRVKVQTTCATSVPNNLSSSLHRLLALIISGHPFRTRRIDRAEFACSLLVHYCDIVLRSRGAGLGPPRWSIL